MIYKFSLPSINRDHMPNNFFITGLPKAGKTTLLRKLIEEMKEKGIKVGGFISPEEKIHGTRTGFKVEDIESGKRATLAAVDIDGPRVSKYHVNIKSFEWLAVPILRNAEKYDVIVIDEIGRMEMKSTKFGNLLADLLESQTPLIASLHRDYIEDYKVWGEVMILTPSNRGRVYLDLLRGADGYKRPKKAKKKAVKKKKKPKKAKKKVAKKKAKPKKKITKKKAKKKPKKKKPGKPKKRKPKKPKRKEEEEEIMAEEITKHKGERKEKKEKIEEEKEEGWRVWVREHVGV